MTTKTTTILKCDQCQKEVVRDSAIGWRSIRIKGIDDTSFADPVFPADLCSEDCIILYIQKT